MPENPEDTVLSLAIDKGIRPTITRLTDEIKQLREALATAVARARREAMEEAAKAAERVRDDLYPILNKTRYQDYEVRRYHKLSVGLVVEDIRALAATLPEARQTETGRVRSARLIPWEPDSHGGVALVFSDGLQCAIALDPPATGNLDGEGRS